MNDWSIELFQNQFDSPKLAKKFSYSFPQRPVSFFERVIDSVDDVNAKLFLLLIDGKVRGASFGFRISGYKFDVWSPSYLFVDEEHRDISLLFILRVLKEMSTNIIDVSPTKDVRKILTAFKYKEISKGSFLIPAIMGGIKTSSNHKLTKCSSPIERFGQREDLIWLKSKQGEPFFCLKKTSRYGIPFFVLVYFDKRIIQNYITDLLFIILKINPLGVLILPNLGTDLDVMSLKSSKFYSFSNISKVGDYYSILGSEVTEAI
tara:strand:- start:200 stop:985 length:786 start_codon:yes stop_codon:yes gene_type:complete